MKLSKDKTALIVNDSLTLAGIPPDVFAYRLGNRSALEWVIDQYRIKTDKRSRHPLQPQPPRRRGIHRPPRRSGRARQPGNGEHRPRSTGGKWGVRAVRGEYLGLSERRRSIFKQETTL